MKRSLHLVLLVLFGPAMLAACTQDIPLPAVTLGEEPVRLDGGTRNRPSPPSESDAGADPAQPGPDADPPPSAPKPCKETPVRGVDQLNPQVLLALDRSASMFAERPGEPHTLMESTQELLLDLFDTFHRSIHFGYVDFPGRSCPADTCCTSSLIPPHRLNPDSLAIIERRWRCDSPAGEVPCQKSTESTPASAALWEAWDQFRDRDAEASRHVFLITDGEPSCAVKDADECQQAAKNAATLGEIDVRTVVIGLGEGLRTNACLQAVAAVGRANSTAPTPAHIVAADADGLRAALEFALDEIAEEACTFRMSQSLELTERIGLFFDTEFVPEDPSKTDGWSFEDGSRGTFTVHGKWCNKLRTSKVDRMQVYRCGT